MSEEAVKRSPEDGEQPTKRQREDETSEAPPAKVPAAKETTAPKETVDRSKVRFSVLQFSGTVLLTCSNNLVA